MPLFNKSTIDFNKPTAMMLGRWQPFHDGHKALFIEALKKTGQVMIMVRDMPKSNDNPFGFWEVFHHIHDVLKDYHGKFEVISVANITNICYGRDVGYSIDEIVLPEQIQKISATKIREEMKK